MPRAQTRPKQRKGIVKVKAKSRGYKVAQNDNFEHSALDYDVSISQFANYKQLGLLADSNQIGSTKGRVTGFKPRVKGPMAAKSDADAVHPLELEVPEAKQTIRQVPGGERQVLLKLVAKHGEDFSAMARDMKLNTHQHTGAHLRRRIAKMRQEEAKEGAAAAAAAAAGEKHKERFRKKITKKPNRAFKKDSMNFN